MTDHALAAQQAAEAQVEALDMWLNDDGPEPVDMAGPYCGCLTCQVRETLAAAYPHLRALWEAER